MSHIQSQHILLGISLIVWCLIHSCMISVRGVSIARSILKSQFRFYRIIYNMIAVLTLVPVFIIMHSISPVVYFEWLGLFRIVQIALFALGLFFLLAGARHYDGMQFFGIRQLQSKKHKLTLSKSGELYTDGILKVTRHPWYVAGFCILWAREVNSVSLITNALLSIYLIIGTFLEERKLVQQFGHAYVSYQKRVSMFFPFKWLAELLQR